MNHRMDGPWIWGAAPVDGQCFFPSDTGMLLGSMWSRRPSVKHGAEPPHDATLDLIPSPRRIYDKTTINSTGDLFYHNFFTGHRNFCNYGAI